MSIVKELWIDNRTQRIEETVVRVVDEMDMNSLIKYAIQQMNDYYNNVASHEEREEFLREHEELPF